MAKIKKFNDPISWKLDGRTERGQSIGPYLQRKVGAKMVVSTTAVHIFKRGNHVLGRVLTAFFEI